MSLTFLTIFHGKIFIVLSTVLWKGASLVPSLTSQQEVNSLFLSFLLSVSHAVYRHKYYNEIGNIKRDGELRIKISYANLSLFPLVVALISS